jgi:hypothetical protein
MRGYLTSDYRGDVDIEWVDEMRTAMQASSSGISGSLND